MILFGCYNVLIGDDVIMGEYVMMLLRWDGLWCYYVWIGYDVIVGK